MAATSSNATKHEEALERMGSEVVGQGRFDVIDEIWAADVIDHDPAPDQPAGAEGIRTFWRQFRQAFPDVAVQVDSMVVDENLAAAALTLTGTHQGPFQGVEPTGRRIQVRGMQMTRFEDGKIVERWGTTDRLSLWQQLGVTPPG